VLSSALLVGTLFVAWGRMKTASRIYRFGDFTLDVGEQQLRRSDAVVFLRPRPFETLLYLVERHGHLVRKRELLDRVWAETNVTESVLSNAIAELRRALDDDVDKPRYISTVPRLGYRFIAETEEDDPVSEGQRSASMQAAPESAIVVLPFSNISADPENEHFCDGLSEELINGLTKVPSLRVVAHTSAFSFKGRDADVREIGRKLNVGSVLEGSVRKAGKRLRISVQLIDATNGYHLWSEQFDRRLEDVFAIQDEIARAILEKLRIGRSEEAPDARHAKPPTRDMEA
jgi:TolB-like protein